MNKRFNPASPITDLERFFVKILNRYGRMRLRYLKKSNPSLFFQLKTSGALRAHILNVQKNAEFEIGQLTSAGLEEYDAEMYVLQECIYA